MSEQRADVFRALSDPSRRRILHLLADRSMSAGDIAAHFDFTKTSLSRHLKILREAELIVSDRHGTTLEYSANLSVLEGALIGLMNRLGISKEDESEEG
jgi:DNA-binding transcriptional ArsR family regulator